jgi:hypothetical protein
MRHLSKIALLGVLGTLCSPAGAWAWSGKVIIHERVEGADAVEFQFQATLPDADTFTLGDGGTETRKVHPGSYEVGLDDSVAFARAADYELRDLFCTESKRDDSSLSRRDGRVRIQVQKDEVVECTFVHARAAARKPTAPPPPPPPPPVVPPAHAVEPLRPADPPVVHGTAKLRGPTGCASSRRAVRPTVTGTQIASVTFSVDGRRMRRVNASASGNRWSVTLWTPHMRRGTHRVRAVVSFYAQSRTKTRVLNLAFARCAAAAPTPKFTG